MEHGKSYKLHERQISAQCKFDSCLLDHIERQLFLYRNITKEDCWEWTRGSDSSAGYGGIYIDKEKYRISRLSAMLYLGLDIKNSKIWICHTCDNPPCFNPKHLYLGTAKTNRIDQLNSGIREADYKLECKYGHQMLGDNLYIQDGVGRSCKTCRREKAVAYQRKKNSNL